MDIVIWVFVKVDLKGVILGLILLIIFLNNLDWLDFFILFWRRSVDDKIINFSILNVVFMFFFF